MAETITSADVYECPASRLVASKRTTFASCIMIFRPNCAERVETRETSRTRPLRGSMLFNVIGCINEKLGSKKGIRSKYDWGIIPKSCFLEIIIIMLQKIFFLEKCKHHFLKHNEAQHFMKFRHVFIEIDEKQYEFDPSKKINIYD